MSKLPLFDWADSRPVADVIPFADHRFNRHALHPQVAAELELRRRLGYEPPTPFFRLCDGRAGAEWYKPADPAYSPPWITCASPPRRA